MNQDKIYSSGVAAAKDYFGSETAQGFMQEWKALTAEDKIEITEGLVKLGYQIKPAA